MMMESVHHHIIVGLGRYCFTASMASADAAEVAIVVVVPDDGNDTCLLHGSCIGDGVGHGRFISMTCNHTMFSHSLY